MTRATSTLALAALALAIPLRAQTGTPAPAAAPPVVSGLIFGSYNYQLPPSSAPLPNQANNSFIVDRAYLTVRLPAGDRLSVRLTADVYQSSEATANAYTYRAKYAYVQYDAPKRATGAQLMGRLGILQNVVIDHAESFWPRYLSTSAVERALYFSSADVGVAGQYTLPNRMGEIYGTIVNGPGYTSRERDRFKDIALRVSLTPLARRATSPLLQSFTITAWGYKGATASGFVNGGAGQLQPVGEALDRSRGGLLAGIRDSRLVVAAEIAQRHEGGELGGNTTASPRTPTGITGRLISGMTIVRPLAFRRADRKSPYGILARYDHVRPSISTTGYVSPPSTSDAYHVLIAGAFADISPRVQFALDYQEQLTSRGTGQTPNPVKGYYAHFAINF